jgi:hypothetical protein
MSLIFAIYLIMVAYTFLHDYEILNIGNIILFLSIIICFLKNGRQIVLYNRDFACFILSTWIIELIFHVKDVSVGALSSMILYSIFILLCPTLINVKKLYVYYKYIGIIVTLLIIIQFLELYILKIEMTSFWFPKIIRNFSREGELRPSACFTEPQAYVSYVVFLLIWSIYNKKKCLALFWSIGIICSTSSTGIALLGVIWLIYLFFDKKDSISKVTKKIIGLIFIILFGVFLANKETFKEFSGKLSLEKMLRNARIVKGFGYYYDLPKSAKMLGVGFYNVWNYMQKNNVYSTWMIGTVQKEFVTSFSAILVYFGIVPFVIFVFTVIKYIKLIKHDNELFTILICILLMMFTQSALYNSFFSYYWIIFFLNMKYKNEIPMKYKILKI